MPEPETDRPPRDVALWLIAFALELETRAIASGPPPIGDTLRAVYGELVRRVSPTTVGDRTVIGGRRDAVAQLIERSIATWRTASRK